MKTAINVIGDYLPNCPDLVRFPMSADQLKIPQGKNTNLERGKT